MNQIIRNGKAVPVQAVKAHGGVRGRGSYIF
jgi:hypothetical protein